MLDTANVREALAAAREGRDLVVEHLTVSERWEVATQLGWVGQFSHAYLVEWAAGPMPCKVATPGPDYEGAILAQQEADESRWG